MQSILFALVLLSIIAGAFSDPPKPTNIFSTGIASVLLKNIKDPTRISPYRYYIDLQNQALRLDYYGDSSSITTQIYEFAKNESTLLYVNQNGTYVCHITTSTENLFKINMFKDATYKGLSTIDEKIVNVWNDGEIFGDKVTIYMEAFTGVVVGFIGTEVSYHVTFESPVVDKRLFQIPQEVKCTKNSK